LEKGYTVKLNHISHLILDETEEADYAYLEEGFEVGDENLEYKMDETTSKTSTSKVSTTIESTVSEKENDLSVLENDDLPKKVEEPQKIQAEKITKTDDYEFDSWEENDSSESWLIRLVIILIIAAAIFCFYIYQRSRPTLSGSGSFYMPSLKNLPTHDLESSRKLLDGFSA
jgi:hypothetical protein